MHLMDEAIAADGGSVHHAAEQKRSAGPVNACHPQDNAVVGEDDLLGLAQHLCVFGIGLGCALFGNETSVILWINAARPTRRPTASLSRTAPACRCATWR